METHVRTPQDVFMQPQHLVVPPFQRPYVWDKEEQWEPLWQDVRRLAELKLSKRVGDVKHFLGAIVVQAQESILGDLQASSIIDGQQRLTTLQLLMDATAAALESVGEDALALQLDRLTHNEEIYVVGSEGQLKLRHTNKDGPAFTEVMSATTPVEHDALEHSASRVVRAHEYFTGSVAAWLEADDGDASARGQALTTSLTQGIQLVAINLAANENSQEIFETLNARGTPLTAADLIRNFVFQRLANDGSDMSTHLDDWPFETDFWEAETSAGRFRMQRSSLFFNQWLVARVGEEVSPRSTFNRFKQYVEQIDLEKGQKVADLLPVIRKQAERYEAWTNAAWDNDKQLSRVELSIYRMDASGTELLKALLIWLHEPGRDLPQDVIDQVVATAESWLVRRQMLRLSLSDLGRIVAEIIRANDDAPADELPDRVQSQLRRLNVTSTYWPGDTEIRETIRTERAYRRFKRARLRMLLEAIEDLYRHETDQPQVQRDTFPIEHILPQEWEDRWPVSDTEAAEDRAEHVHRLGNLTLLTSALNGKVSNGPWASKRDALQHHDTLLMNARLLASADDEWDEATIDARTDVLVDALLEIWPVPEGHEGRVKDPEAKSAGWIQVKHLVDAGLLAPGTALVPRTGDWDLVPAIVRSDGLLEVDGETFETPSGAGKRVKGAVTNGWKFWSLPDGRKLSDVRAAYGGEEPASSSSADWTTLHTLLSSLPVGRWTTYESLADTIGSTPELVQAHIAGCNHCANTHRVLSNAGVPAGGVNEATSRGDGTTPNSLSLEGGLVNGKPDPARRLSGDDLQALIEA